MSMDWAAGEAAIVAWVAGAAPGHEVIWANQGAVYPDPPFCSLAWLSMAETSVRPEPRTIFDAGRPAGEEFEIRATSVLDLTLSVNVFGAGTAARGNDSPMAVMQRLRSRLGLEQYRRPLRVAGWGRFGMGPVQNVPALFQATWQPQVQCDFLLYAVATESQFVGYINEVRGTITLRPSSLPPIAYDVELEP